MGGGTKWSLGPTTELLRELGDPHHHFPSIHIAGTNGKGSTATLVYQALHDEGFRVGLYTSPHLVSLTERVTVDGQPITEDAFVEWVDLLRPSIERVDASFFEAYTAIAFADFAARGVDIAVIETGLGGRLDSTNVIDPVVSAVTNVGLEHQAYLGDSLGRIAWEKAHVAKKGVPLVIGEGDPELVEVICSVARERGADPVTVDAEELYDGALAMPGTHQRRNAALARRMLESLPEVFAVRGPTVERAFSRARIAGRFDRRGAWIFDVAHNEHAVRVLCDELTRDRPAGRVHALVGILNDKDFRSMLADLERVVDEVYVTVPPAAPAERILRPEIVAAEFPTAVTEPDFDEALRRVGEGSDTVLVTGSVFTVGDAMARLPGLSPLG